MRITEGEDRGVERTHAFAQALFVRIETAAYLVLGLLLALVTLIAVLRACAALAHAVLSLGGGDSILHSIDLLLFVFMLVEILHTVRVTFRTGQLVCEPFLIVGLIASIRRVLVITLQTSRSHDQQSTTAAAQTAFHASMLELGVLGGLIVVMVVSIAVLRRSGAGDAGV